ncbi:MAG: alkaline phosphatase family protein [Candidatus Wallbacteria bacterium]|nr:alkaline phosphatase family protein [Candidatus Wallbacteria bacterium]
MENSRMNGARRGLRLALAALLAFASAASPALAEGLFRHVVIVSVDGLRPDAITAARTPVLAGLIRRGSSTLKARTTLPSVTLVSHASMLTGVRPDVHGITWNTEDQKGPLKARTIFQLAARAGLSTAVIAGKKRLKQLIPDTRVTPFFQPGWTAAPVVKAASKLFAEKPPALTLVHLTDPDNNGHKDGWMTPFYFKGVASADRALGQLLTGLDAAGIRQETLLIVTADHGGKGKSHGPNTPECVLIPWIAHGPGVRPGYVLKKPVSTCDTAATALWALGVPVPSAIAGKPMTEAFRR